MLLRLIRCIPIPFLAGVIAGAACLGAARGSLGLYLGALAMLTILLPPLAAAQIDRLGASLAAAAVIDGIALVWLAAVFAGVATISQWLQAYVVLAAYGLFLLGLTCLLVRFAHPLAAGAAVCIVGILWLTWPLWLSPWLAGAAGAHAAARLTLLHPPMAINTIFRDLGVWVQQPFMYAHSSLAQDIPFELPRHIVPGAAVHAILGFILLALARPRRISAPAEWPTEWSPEEAAAKSYRA
jgi:hypothetical protein